MGGAGCERRGGTHHLHQQETSSLNILTSEHQQQDHGEADSASDSSHTQLTAKTSFKSFATGHWTNGIGPG